MRGPPVMGQAALARACGLSKPTVSNWLGGRTKDLKGPSLLAAAKALKVNPEWLASGKGPMRDESVKVESVSHSMSLDLDTFIRAVKFMQRIAALHGATFDPLRDADLFLTAYAVEAQIGAGSPGNLLDFGDALRKRMANRGEYDAATNKTRGAGQ